MLISDLFQYPVKGLSEASLQSVELDEALGMAGDRRFAITHAKSLFDHEKPAWIARKHFAVVAHSPEIGPIHCRYDVDTQLLELSHAGSVILVEKVGSADMDAKLSKALSSVIKDGQQGPYRLVSAPRKRLTDSPTQTVSIMNTKSLQALSDAVGQPLEKRRFRGNIWFEGDRAWQEHDWVGKAIEIGGVKLFVNERIERCAAVDADPVLGVRNLSVLKQLNQSFGHVDFGVLAQVEKPGLVRTGDTINGI